MEKRERERERGRRRAGIFERNNEGQKKRELTRKVRDRAANQACASNHSRWGLKNMHVCINIHVHK